jgi:hypothetical protein
MKYVLLLILPVIILVNLYEKRMTVYDFDPNYIYLFNGVNLATKYGDLGHYDNPGTPVIVLSAAIMKVTHFIRNTQDDFPIDVLKNPQYYVKVIAWTFAVINVLLLFISGLLMMKITGEISFSVIFQTLPYLSKTPLFWSFQLVSPEPLLFGTTIILVLVFLWRYYFNKSPGTLRLGFANGYELDVSVLWFGLITGFGVATKLNFFPLIFLPFLFINGLKNKGIYLLTSFASFIFFTLPIASYYRMLSNWILSLILHSGNYGTGSTNVVDFHKVYENFVLFIKDQPVLFSIITISIVFVLKQIIQRRSDNDMKIFTGLLLIQIVYLAMALKHYEEHYLIPIIPTFSINLFLIIKLLKLSKMMRFAIIVPFVVFIVWLNHIFPFHTAPDYYYLTSDEKSIEIYSYNCNSPMYGLKYGNDYSKSLNTPYLEKIYGKQYFYNLWLHQITDWQDTVSFASLKLKNKPIYLYMLEPYLIDWPTPYRLKKVSDGKYLIEGSVTDTLNNKLNN